jgi:hypothetical protein
MRLKENSTIITSVFIYNKYVGPLKQNAADIESGLDPPALFTSPSFTCAPTP